MPCGLPRLLLVVVVPMPPPLSPLLNRIPSPRFPPLPRFHTLFTGQGELMAEMLDAAFDDIAAEKDFIEETARRQARERANENVLQEGTVCVGGGDGEGGIGSAARAWVCMCACLPFSLSLWYQVTCDPI